MLQVHNSGAHNAAMQQGQGPRARLHPKSGDPFCAVTAWRYSVAIVFSLLRVIELLPIDSIWRKLSYSLHLLIGLGFVFSQPIDHGGRSAAKG